MSGYVIPEDMQFIADDLSTDWCCTSEWDEWGCTREQGHAGKHEAGYGADDGRALVAAIWDDADGTP